MHSFSWKLLDIKSKYGVGDIGMGRGSFSLRGSEMFMVDDRHVHI